MDKEALLKIKTHSEEACKRIEDLLILKGLYGRLPKEDLEEINKSLFQMLMVRNTLRKLCALE